MHTYVAFLRGINVGGNSLIKMAELKDCLTKSGLNSVMTYIQSGNVIFQSGSTDKDTLARAISLTICEVFSFNVAVVVFSEAEWKKVITSAPEWWGRDETWKHNLLILTEPYSIDEAVREVGALKPDIEVLGAGERVIYQSVSWQYFGRATSGKLASLSIYKKMTVRNYTTSTKILTLMV